MIRSFFFCFVAAISSPLHANEKIVVAAFEYPPIYQNAKEKGLSGDILIAAFKAVGIDAELEFLPAARMVDSVTNGKYLCGLGGAVLFEGPESLTKVTIGSTLQYVSQTFLYDARRFPNGMVFSHLNQLENYRIGVLFSSGIMKLLEKTNGLHLDANPTHPGSARQLHRARIDLWAVVDLTGYSVLGELFPHEAHHYKSTSSFNRGDVSLVCSHARDPNGVYQQMFKTGLATIKRNGVYMKIMAKYYGGRDKINPDSLPDDMKPIPQNKATRT